jgi:predicted branched-subunit amino acid permease
VRNEQALAIAARRAVIRDAAVVGSAVGAYGLAFGAAAVTAGLSWQQASVMSLLTFTGASQFALVGILGAGGSVLTAVTVAVFLGLRNGLYALRLAPLLPASRLRRAVAAHLVIDESMAMAVSRSNPALGRLAFWATGLSVLVQWNLATIIGALSAVALGDPRRIGLDVVFPAAFLALVNPLLQCRTDKITALLAALVTIVLVPHAAPGVPILAAALTATLTVLYFGQKKCPT